MVQPITYLVTAHKDVSSAFGTGFRGFYTLFVAAYTMVMANQYP